MHLSAMVARVAPAVLCGVVLLLVWYPLRIDPTGLRVGAIWERAHDVAVALALMAAAPSVVRIVRTRGSWLRDLPLLYFAVGMVSVIPLLGVPTLGLPYARMQWVTLATFAAVYLFSLGVALRRPRVAFCLGAAWCSWAVVSAVLTVGSAALRGRLVHDAVHTMGHTNSRAGFEMVVLLFLLGSTWCAIPRLKNAAVPVLLLLGTSVTFSLSRGAWMGFIAGCAAFVAWGWGWRKAAVVLSAGLVLLVLLPGTIGQRARSVGDGELPSNVFRIEVWRSAVSLIAENPWGGSGYDTLWFSMLSQLGSDVPTLAGKHVHNLLLQTWAEIGLLGAAALVGVFIFLFRTGLVMARKGDKLRRAMGRGVLIALVGTVAHALVDCTWRDYGHQVMFWSMAGWMAGAAERESLS